MINAIGHNLEKQKEGGGAGWLLVKLIRSVSKGKRDGAREAREEQGVVND